MGHGVSSVFFRADWYFAFMVLSAGNIASRKLIIQNGRSIFRVISEFIGNSILIPTQNSLNDFLGDPRWQLQEQFFKIIPTNTTQSKGILI